MAGFQAVAKAFKFGTDTWDPTRRFETSWLLPPTVLFFIRALFAFYIFFTLVFIAAWRCANAENHCIAAQESFSYFTVLTYWGLGFYFLFAALHTGTYIWSSSHIPLLNRWPRPLQALHGAFYTTICVYPLIVTIVFWGILYEGPWFPVQFTAWTNVSQHAMNAGFALFEMVIPRTEPPSAVHILWLVVVLALYLCLAYVTHATRGFYTYNFLDPEIQHSMVAAYAVGIAVGGVIAFGVVWLLIWTRKWITETKLGKTGKFVAERPLARNLESGLDVEHKQAASV